MLDNADGQLARATGRVSVARPLSRLGVGPARERRGVRRARVRTRGTGLAALAAFVVLTLVLSVDFDLERLYRREQRRRARPGAARAPGRPAALLARVYARRLRHAGPADRALRRPGACATPARRRGSPTTTAPRFGCWPTSGSRRSSPCSASASALGRPLTFVCSPSVVAVVGRSFCRRELLARRAGRDHHEEVTSAEENVVDLRQRRLHRAEADAAGDRTGRLAAVRALHGGDLHRARHGAGHARHAARRRSGSCGRSTTRPPATTATRSC